MSTVVLPCSEDMFWSSPPWPQIIFIVWPILSLSAYHHLVHKETSLTKAREFINPRDEASIILLYKKHSIKLPSKYIFLYPHIRTAVSPKCHLPELELWTNEHGLQSPLLAFGYNCSLTVCIGPHINRVTQSLSFDDWLISRASVSDVCPPCGTSVCHDFLRFSLCSFNKLCLWLSLRVYTLGPECRALLLLFHSLAVWPWASSLGPIPSL